MNEAIVRGENPEAPFIPSEQDFTSDLSPEGQEKAREKAKEFLSQFDPQKDTLYFASSNLVRARETAAIFLDEAEKQGFEILEAQPKSAHRRRNDVEKSLGGEEIRTLESLSLHINNMLVEFMFNPGDYMNPRPGEEAHVLFPENVSPATRELWEEGRKIIESDNKGTWGKNFLAHSAAIRKLFEEYKKKHPSVAVPRVTTAEDMNNSRFRTMLQEMKRVKDRMGRYEEEEGKRIRVLAFSHENAFLHFLDKEFDQKGIDKLEAIGYEVITDEAGKDHYYAAIEDPTRQSTVKEIELPRRVD